MAKYDFLRTLFFYLELLITILPVAIGRSVFVAKHRERYDDNKHYYKIKVNSATVLIWLLFENFVGHQFLNILLGMGMSDLSAYVVGTLMVLITVGELVFWVYWESKNGLSKVKNNTQTDKVVYHKHVDNNKSAQELLDDAMSDTYNKEEPKPKTKDNSLTDKLNGK